MDGNIWFETDTNDYDFNLRTCDDNGPCIAGWNQDLDSEDYGEYRVQRKTDPDRVVIEWITETYDDNDDGLDVLNNFEIILYKNGEIRVNYNYFNCAICRDSSSGVSKGVPNGSVYTSLTEKFGPVPGLGQTSYIFTCP
ncbi:MAG TPA: hypothetical protein ENH04_02875 [Nitrospirae bacterium]|nr:hypothetical protein [Nitrospirota bacterium]